MTNKFNLDNLTRENIRNISPYSSARDEFQSTGNSMIFLDANENPFETDVNRYPDPQQRDLKEELSAIKGVHRHCILLGNGSDEVLDLLFRAFCEPGKDNVITLPPTYGMYKVLAGINNIENREVLLTTAFEPDVKQILKKIDEATKMIFLCSPNNPTGNSFSEANVLEILENFSGLVVIDEAYIDFSEKESWIKRLEDFPNLVITQTLSKAYGMAGIRLGICYASEEIIRILNRIKPPYNVNELTQQRALERLQHKEDVDSEVSGILDERKGLFEALLEVNYISKVYPSDANFFLILVDDAGKRYEQLLEKNIVIRNRTKEPLCENTLRITIGTAKENKELLQALKELE
ncbi:histidinol-phosphate transaminase [Antarcticibacterium flavum]|uniref:Histidinol-phosphate aminotransferase n=1 Tax=Antarcticibacterium flavum TaxID=2058175 RepID=A0A5B7X0L4_9FLAO|nr:MULTISPECIES: histidinol-phosphate transaminase [Antarcticibacterium]MCM4158971.1 histidinol-phosphate transaminase [Antarcticibacterium sp. W02-3]QCY68222.1 histidinol-phosphate transaminase [Antarcticibacterium flavum]